ncbi:hypothetical protein ERUR111494_06460 [Erysipelothrix urinaevulpis]
MLNIMPLFLNPTTSGQLYEIQTQLFWVFLTVYSIYEQLPKKFFSYANSGTIVNYAYIATIKKNVIEMKYNQEVITISRRNKNKIIKKI